MNHDSQKPLVVIQCMVYNHKSYLRDCFEGFIKQQTNFPFLILVHDDVSTDGSIEIILEYKEKYPHLFQPILETENQYSKPDAALWKITNDAICATGAKYVAVCEGDDFWTDPLKLQKQIDILENDNTLIAVCSDTSIVDNEGNVLNIKRGNVVKDNIEGRYNLRDFFDNKHQYPTASVVYRNTYNEEVKEKYLSTINSYLGDWTMWICLHIYGDFYYIDQPMVAYRINPNSVTHNYNRVGRAKAHKEISVKVAEILPNEYQDISNELRNVDWVWVILFIAYKHEKKYLRMLGALVMSLIKCPSLLYNRYKNRSR